MNQTAQGAARQADAGRLGDGAGTQADLVWSGL